MDDFSQSVLKKVEHLYSRIERKSNLIALYGMFLNKKDKEKYTAIFNMQVIINHCLQCGNYWRACRYIIIAEKLISNFEENEYTLKSKVTDYFVKD